MGCDGAGGYWFGADSYVCSGWSSRSGKSTALKTLAASSLDAGVPVVLVTPLRSPLQGLADCPGVRVCSGVLRM